MQCCPEYHHLFTDPRSHPPSSHTPFGWPGFSDQFFQGYPTTHDNHSHLYPGTSSVSTPHLVNSHASLIPTTHPAASPVSSTLPTGPVGHGHGHSTPGLVCMWANCGVTFATMNELVGHVNLQHLRLPSTGGALHQPVSPSIQAPRNDPSSLSCLWADCQVYPTPSSVPGPSVGNQTDNALGVLASHLLQDHLGLPTPASGSASDAASSNQDASPRSTANISPPVSCPPTPAPEHDCSAPQAHVCRWTGCGEGFASCDALTAHINASHVGSGKAHYDCYWEGCSRHGDNGFASKQKICRHLQVCSFCHGRGYLHTYRFSVESYRSPTVPVQDLPAKLFRSGYSSSAHASAYARK